MKTIGGYRGFTYNCRSYWDRTLNFKTYYKVSMAALRRLSRRIENSRSAWTT